MIGTSLILRLVWCFFESLLDVADMKGVYTKRLTENRLQRRASFLCRVLQGFVLVSEVTGGSWEISSPHHSKCNFTSVGESQVP